MLGTLFGDLIGSVYEGRTRRIKTKDFSLVDPDCRFADDTVLTRAIADARLKRK